MTASFCAPSKLGASAHVVILSCDLILFVVHMGSERMDPVSAYTPVIVSSMCSMVCLFMARVHDSGSGRAQVDDLTVSVLGMLGLADPSAPPLVTLRSTGASIVSLHASNSLPVFLCAGAERLTGL